ncbi:MAG: hypothetical protein Q4C05_09190 [Akkermansia sp.]|nr:hypothetical protein [Akkermansia sp.]
MRFSVISSRLYAMRLASLLGLKPNGPVSVFLGEWLSPLASFACGLGG